MPPAPIELGNGESEQAKVVSQKNQRSTSIRIIVFNAAKFLGIPLMSVETGEHDCLIAPEYRALIYRMRVKPMKPHVGRLTKRLNECMGM